jgi:glycosyltransferase involved in cell wall biosynthesis
MPGRATILVLIKGLGIGGAERLISEGSAFWNRSRFDYRVAYVLPWKDQLVGDLENRGIDVTCLGGPRGTSAGAARRLRRLIGSLPIDLVHAHLPATGVLARLVSPVPVVYTEHNLASSYRLPVRLLNRATYGRNAAVIAVSDAVATSLDGYPGPSPVVIRNGVSTAVDTDARERVRTELGLALDDPLVVHVGNIRPHKGHDVLVEAARRLLRQRPGISVVSIGAEKHPGDLARVDNLASDLPRLTFLGRRSDARDFIAAADVLVNPSTVEGLPVTILEAIASRTPVVATAVGGVPSVIHDGETGLLVQPNDPDALSDGILRLLDDPALAARLATGAYDLVVRDYGLQRMVRAVEETYEELLRG